MQIKDLLSVLDCSTVTICYAGFGERIYKGPINDNIPSYVLNYFVTVIIPKNDSAYIEVHENMAFLDVPIHKFTVSE